MNKPDPWVPVREPPLRVEGLVKGYGGRRVIDGLDLRVEAGRIVLLAGVNGAGKSTALRASLGLARPERGSCAFWGRPLRTLEPAVRWVGVAFATPRHHPSRTVLAEARLAATAGGLSRAAAARAVAQVGLSDAADVRAGALSRGMRQRLGLAVALVGDPPLLLLDEPLSGIDTAGVDWLIELLDAHRRRGGAALVCSHVTDPLADIVDDVAVLHRGRVTVKESLPRMVGERRVVARSTAAEALAEALRPLAAAVEVDGELVRVEGLTAQEIGACAAATALALSELREVRADRARRVRSVVRQGTA